MLNNILDIGPFPPRHKNIGIPPFITLFALKLAIYLVNLTLYYSCFMKHDSMRGIWIKIPLQGYLDSNTPWSRRVFCLNTLPLQV